MKKTLILTTALIGGIALPVATMADTVLGCEVVDMGGYLNKADPTCVFKNEDARGSRLVLGDHDDDPATPDTLASIDN